MNKKDCEHLACLLSSHKPVNWDLCKDVFAMDDRIEPDYEIFQELQGQSDEIIELTEDLMREYNGELHFLTEPGAIKKTYGECLEEARRTVLGDDYDPTLFRR